MLAVYRQQGVGVAGMMGKDGEGKIRTGVSWVLRLAAVSLVSAVSVSTTAVADEEVQSTDLGDIGVTLSINCLAGGSYQVVTDTTAANFPAELEDDFSPLYLSDADDWQNWDVYDNVSLNGVTTWDLSYLPEHLNWSIQVHYYVGVEEDPYDRGGDTTNWVTAHTGGYIDLAAECQEPTEAPQPPKDSGEPDPSEAPQPPARPSDGSWVYVTPGYHEVNGRKWHTDCEPYSQTVRCETKIWATTIRWTGNRYASQNSWVFNNLTYLPEMTRSQWAHNPLGSNGQWTTATGRQWRTECDTPNTGKGGCRSYIMATVIETAPAGGYRYVNKWVFNNIVLYKQ